MAALGQGVRGDPQGLLQSGLQVIADIHSSQVASEAAGRKRAGRLKWLLAPLWAAEVFTSAKTCDRNSILGSAALNRRGLHVWRGRLARRLAEARRDRLARRLDRADVAAFARDGYVAVPDFAPPDLYRRVQAEIASLRAPGWETREADAVTRLIPLTTRLLETLPAVRELTGLARWRNLLSYVAGFEARPSLYVQSVFGAGPDGFDPQTRLHMDTFHPTMKAWLYLQDVEEADGPFTYTPGSHLRTPRRDAWERRRSVDAADPSTPSRGGSFRVSRSELKRLGCAQPVKLCARANTLVVADTYGFHARGQSRTCEPRVAIYAACRRNPFLPWTGAPLPPALRRRLDRWGEVLVERRRVRKGGQAARLLTPTEPPQA